MTDDTAPDEWTVLWEARERALERLLGPTTERVFHSLVPLPLGGGADVLEFPAFVSGSTYVTAELTGPPDQPESSLGQYELMICTREPEDWAPNLLSRLAPYTPEAVIDPFETMDIGPALPAGSTIAAFLFTEPPLPENSFLVADQQCGLLLCVGITAAELALCHRGLSSSVLEALIAADVFPFTDLTRASVSLPGAT